MSGVQNLTVQDNVGSVGGDFGDGIVVDNSSENRIQGNTVRRNGPYSGISLIGASRHNEVRDNAIDAAGNNNPGPTENRVVGNSAHGNGAYDGFDGNVNPRCDANVWEDNDFGSVNQRCVSFQPAPADGSTPDER